ncbi:glycine cleavage system aminomethyltransferase GcvT [Kiloniella sp. b19]|uniref:glycine cleavage system aminomethyltransferase GcvT n=1 Tax=Kiloniella sp. GXU_MW_B19 TaxID=3141326 RepID=UPI0031E371D6
MSGFGNVTDQADLNKTVLHSLHVELGAKMVPFAGYDMPVQYPAGIMAEHQHTRESAALFDVSHMGVVRLRGADALTSLEKLLPADVQAMKVGAIRYSFFTNDQGGILDDLMITREEDGLYLVINAACKDADIQHMRDNLEGDVTLTIEDNYALVAFQGPKAAEVLSELDARAGEMKFMTAESLTLAGVECFVSRSGYTGEDGYEIYMPGDQADALVRKLLADERVEFAGLGARDSLRMEAGLCLYGNDIDTTTTPIEAGLLWAIQKRRREEGGFPGAAIIQDQIANGAPRRLVGVLPEGRAPLRPGVELVDGDENVIGRVTSGGFGPSVGGPIAIAYVDAAFKEAGTEISALVRKKALPCKVVKMPFEKKSYYRG